MEEQTQTYRAGLGKPSTYDSPNSTGNVRESLISRQIIDLDNEIQRTDSLIDKLNMKISPVLSMELPKPEGQTGEPVPSLPLLAETIKTEKDKLLRLNTILADIIARIEL